MREERPDQHCGAAPGAEEDVAGRGDEDRRSEQVTPPIADDTDNRTTSPAEPGDVGVPPDDELAERDE